VSVPFQKFTISSPEISRKRPIQLSLKDIYDDDGGGLFFRGGKLQLFEVEKSIQTTIGELNIGN
jgi:hypothetical protein